MTIKFTRKQRLANECSHHEYYSQFVDDGVKARVLSSIKLSELISATDPHLNDISISRWDSVFQPYFPRYISDKMRAAGDYPTLAGAVCIGKAAARQIIKKHKESDDVSN